MYDEVGELARVVTGSVQVIQADVDKADGLIPAGGPPPIR